MLIYIVNLNIYFTSDILLFLHSFNQLSFNFSVKQVVVFQIILVLFCASLGFYSNKPSQREGQSPEWDVSNLQSPLK